MFETSKARALWSLTTFCFTVFTLQALCHGSTFSPVTSPLGDNVYITDIPTLSTSGVTLSGCATRCRFYSALNGGSSICRCFNYNSSNANCSVFAFQPTTVDVSNSIGSPTAYQTSDNPVTALFPIVNRRQCLFPFLHNGQNSFDCLHNNRPNAMGQFGCVLRNLTQAFCNPQSERGLYLAYSIKAAYNWPVTAMAQCKGQLFVTNLIGAIYSVLVVYNATTFEESRRRFLYYYYGGYGGAQTGLAVDCVKDALYVSFNWNRILVINQNTLAISSTLWSMDSPPNALSMNSVNNILVSTTGGGVYEYNSTGSLVRRFLSNFSSVYQAAEVSNGTLVISLNTANDVKLIAVNGTELGSYGSGKLKNPTSLVVDKKGFVLVADSGNNRILAMDQTLTASSNVILPLDIANPITNPLGLWYDESRGRLYVGEGGGQCRVLVIDNMLSISDVLQP